MSNTPDDHKQDEEKLATFFTENMGEMRDIIGLTAAEIEALYATAYTHFQQAEYETALEEFATLTQIAHLDRRFHLGYAATLQASGLYIEAIRAYMLASSLDLSDPEPTLCIGYCLIKLQEYKEAKNVLSLVVEETYNQPTYQALHDKAKAMLSEIAQYQFTHNLSTRI